MGMFGIKCTSCMSAALLIRVLPSSCVNNVGIVILWMTLLTSTIVLFIPQLKKSTKCTHLRTYTTENVGMAAQNNIVISKVVMLLVP